VEHLQRLGEAAIAGLGPFGLGDPARELLAVRDRQRVERGLCGAVAGQRGCERLGYLDLAGAVSSSTATSTLSPACTPAASRTSRFRPSMNSPRIRTTLVRQL
jgi:hypothetical protein